MKRKDQHPDPRGDKRVCAGHQITKGKAFGGEPNSANGAEMRQNARNVEPAHRRISPDIDKPSCASAQETDIGARMRDAQDRRRTLPKAATVIRTEIRPSVGTKITLSDGAEIQAIPEFLKDRQRPLAKSVTAGKVGHGTVTEALFDARR